MRDELSQTGTYTADRFFISPHDNIEQTWERLDELLSETEKRIWTRTMGQAGFWLHLKFDAIIKPVDP